MGDGQFCRAKSYDTFSPMGPTLRVDDGFDPNAIDVACRVDGDLRQDSSIERFVFDVCDLVEYVSANMTLRPGDVISTGTPGGVGVFRDLPALLAPGDTVEIEIEGIGSLQNPVVADFRAD
jgi:2-keto-4-pentenoate hydratase/2-oxohepta-3-ene-1,7-dioic acid hydratase in catechol pathway